MTADDLFAAAASLPDSEALHLTRRLMVKYDIREDVPAWCPRFPGDNGAGEPEPLEEFEVRLTGFREGRRLDVLRAIRAEQKLGLAEAKAILDKGTLGLAPQLHAGRLSRWDARFLAERFEQAGATVASIAYPMGSGSVIADAVAGRAAFGEPRPLTADEQQLIRDFTNRHED